MDSDSVAFLLIGLAIGIVAGFVGSYVYSTYVPMPKAGSVDLNNLKSLQKPKTVTRRNG